MPESSGRYLFHADSVADTDEEEQPGEDSNDSSKAGQQSDPNGHDKKDDWDLAVRYRDIQRFGYLEPKERKEMSEKAIHAILVRAHESLGPVQKPYRYESFSEAQAKEKEALGAVVELDVEESLNQLESLEGRDLVYQVRSEKDHGVLLLIDTSLSMKGEKLALLAVTVAAVAASIPHRALCILGFDSEIHPIKEFGQASRPAQIISEVLSIPPGGFTHMERGLRAAQDRIKQSFFKNARVILISDGRYTEGADPVILAKHFRFLYPVKLGRDPGGRKVMQELAASGQGKFAEVRDMRDLPKFLIHWMRTWVR